MRNPLFELKAFVVQGMATIRANQGTNHPASFGDLYALLERIETEVTALIPDESSEPRGGDNSTAEKPG